MIRFCRRCYKYGKAYDLIEDMIKLALRGTWMCPYSKPECGRNLGTEN